MKRISRRYAVASFCNTDFAEVETYQNTRNRIPVFIIDGDYYIALKGSEKPPDDFDEWIAVGTSFHWRIMKSSGEGAS